jgi:transposase
MELVREVFRLKWVLNKSNRSIGEALSISKSTVSTYLARAKALGIETIEHSNSIDDEKLKEMMFPKNNEKSYEIDFERINKELKRKHVTLMLLWQEEAEKNPDIFGYTRFCGLYKEWKKENKISMRQNHKAGEKGFIDYAGSTVPIHNHKTGEVSNAQIFLMVLGASDHAYVEATYTQQTRDFIGSNISAFEYFGGVPEVLVPDNLKSGVNLASKYEPVINQTYRELANHYGSVVIPARARKPKDKAKVENGVLIAGRWILARIRDRKFFSLEELNEAIWELLEEYNNKKFQKLDCSRRSLFEEVEKEALLPLPRTRFEIAEWKKVRANIDYHVTIENGHYSVPYQLRGKELQARSTDKSVEIFHQGKRVASHARSYKRSVRIGVPREL